MYMWWYNKNYKKKKLFIKQKQTQGFQNQTYDYHRGNHGWER